jgi:RNA methyltransferase, TrmH family
MNDRAPGTAERRLVSSLRQRKERERSGLFLAEGVRVVEELLASTVVPRLAIVASSLGDSERGHALLAELSRRCDTRTVAPHELGHLAATETPQGVIVAAEAPVTDPLSIELPERCTLLLLDAVQDPGNFGTLVRSALAFGTALVITLPGTVDPWNPKAVRSAAGASFRVPIAGMALDDAAAWLRQRSFTVYAADATGRPIPSLPPAPRVALVVGNEGSGLGSGVRGLADEHVGIPMSGPAESLNVGVAAGILLYELARHR